MKKTTAFLFLSFLSAMPSRAETDPKTIQFLDKLNLYYYCQSREGLKNFSCDIKLTLSESFKEKMGTKKLGLRYQKFFNNLRYTLSETAAGDSTVNLVTVPPESDPELDALVARKLKSFQSMVKDSVKTWAESELKPSFDQKTYDRGCKVINNTNGFDVEQTGEDGILTAHYDSQAKTTSVTGQMHGIDITMKPEFVPSAKGFVVTRLNTQMGKASMDLRADHETVGKYWMPKKLIVNVVFPGIMEGSYTLDFSHYRLNP